MKFKPGDRVRIRSFEWYLENKDDNGEIRFLDSKENRESGFITGFDPSFSCMCGAVVTIDAILKYAPVYRATELHHRFGYYGGLVDEMLEPDPVIFEYCIEINGRLDETIYYTEDEARVALEVWKKASPMSEVKIRTLNLNPL